MKICRRWTLSLGFGLFLLASNATFAQNISTLCHFEVGPLAGQTINYAPLPPLPVGYPCHDGQSVGHIVPAVSPVAAIVGMLDSQMSGLANQGQFSGAIYISQRGSVYLDKAYGLADRAQHLQNTTSTGFLIGSLTKQFTAAGILKLHDDGSLNVSDSVCQFINPCPQQWAPITISELLNHSSGIANYTAIPLGNLANSQCRHRRFSLSLRLCRYSSFLARSSLTATPITLFWVWSSKK